MRDFIVGSGLWALAVALVVRGAPGALAQEGVGAPAIAAAGAECVMVRVGTAREYEKLIDGLRAGGRSQILMVSDGVLCGWP